MNEGVRLSYEELCEKLQGDIGRQVFQLALQARIVMRTADSQLRGDYANPRDMPGTIALLAVQDFLDLCFDRKLPGEE